MKKSPLVSSRPNNAITPLGGGASSSASPFIRLSPLPPPQLQSHSSDDASNMPQSTWNAAQVRADLQIAAQLLSDHNLKLAAKFAIEQWMGLPADVVSDATITTSSSWIPAHYKVGKYQQEKCPAVLYAKTLMEMGEYAHAAAILSQPSRSKTIESMPPPLEDLSEYGFYLRAYSLYMAGERRKEEEFMELKGYVFENEFGQSCCLQLLCRPFLTRCFILAHHLVKRNIKTLHLTHTSNSCHMSFTTPTKKDRSTRLDYTFTAWFFSRAAPFLSYPTHPQLKRFL
jgi:hypothetical protein